MHYLYFLFFFENVTWKFNINLLIAFIIMFSTSYKFWGQMLENNNNNNYNNLYQ